MDVGIKKYKDFFTEKENFINYEKRKINRYINYEQYGAYGFRVLFQPTALIIFHPSSFISLEGTIDTKEIVNISINYKGKSIFANNGAFGDFYYTFYVVGSLLMLYFGLNSFYNDPRPLCNGKNCCKGKKKKMILILQIILSRIILLNVFFSGILFAAYATAVLKGIHFTGREVLAYASFASFIIFFITSFYFSGILFAVLLSFKKSLYVAAYAIWFLFLFFVPEINRADLEQKAKIIKSNESINIKKLNNVMRFERRYKSAIDTLKEEKIKNIKPIFDKFLDDYLKNEYSLNKDIEKSMSEDVNKLIDYNRKKSIILPVSFYLFLAREFSSFGYRNYQDFLKYMLSLKEDFSHYFFDKRYSQIGQRVESFVKDDENIFKSKCELPENFCPGLLLLILYSFLFLGSVLLLFRRRIAAADEMAGEGMEDKIEIDIKRMAKGKTYFSFCREKKEKEKIINYLGSSGASMIKKLHLCNFDPGISLKSWLDYECHVRGIAPGDIYAVLQESGISKRKLKLKLKNLDSETLNRAYLQIKLHETMQIYVFDDFLKDVSKDFEKVFKRTIKEIADKAIILYIGSQMFDINVKERKTPTEDCRFFIVNLDNISLR